MRARSRPSLATVAGLLVPAACSAPVDGLAPPDVVLEAPESLDLGWIAREGDAEGTFSVVNVGTSPVAFDAFDAFDVDGGADLTFVAEPDRDRLRPMETARVTVQVRAGVQAAGEYLVPLTVRVLGLPADDSRQPSVELRVRVSPSGLVAEPNPLSIGPVLYRRTSTGTVGIRNLRSVPVEVFALRRSEGWAQYEEAVTRGAFGPLPEVDALGRLFVLEPREVRVVPIEYTAPDSEGEAKEQAIWRVGSCDAPECALDIVIQGLPDHEAPRVKIQPSGVHFGPTPVGEAVTRTLTITNAGQRALELSDFAFEGTDEITARLPAPAALAPGASVAVTFRYLPRDETLDNARLTFRTNDPTLSDALLRVTGSGVVLPPCNVEVRPSALDFGVVPVFEVRARATNIRNTEADACLLFDPRVELGPGTPENTFVLDPNAPSSFTLLPWTVTNYAVTFAPGAPGVYEGTLVIRRSGTDPLEIPLRGRTPDDVRLTCSPDATVTVGAPVPLTAALSNQSTAANYQWRLLNGPVRDGAIAATFRPDAQTGPRLELVPEALGTYAVQAEVQTTDGARFTCQTTVTAVAGGLSATLTWDGPGDLDLHLHRGAGGAEPWFSEADCHFDNMTPRWGPGPARAGPNPALDRDDTSGDGPESISVEAPELGVTYTVGVGHFERAAGRTARVQVACGRASLVLDASSRPFRGSETGACTQNDFWRVATVTFVAPDACEVQMIDDYRTTRAACEAL